MTWVLLFAFVAMAALAYVFYCDGMAYYENWMTCIAHYEDYKRRFPQSLENRSDACGSCCHMASIEAAQREIQS